MHPPAQYILRFDDLCPTMAHARWQRFAELLNQFRVRPILAVVPDNHDLELMLDPPDPHFWQSMRTLQAGGATIALHGYWHLCQARGHALLHLHGETEFAGIDVRTQQKWIEAGLALLRSHGLDPRLFVAPRHGFDRATLRALHAAGIGYLSDGFARMPFRRGGIVWLPQQLWRPVAKPSGLWTICIHPNTATDDDIATLRDFLAAHSAAFTSFDRVCADYTPREISWQQSFCSSLASVRIRLRSLRHTH
jgi:predicted deacetylase